MYVPAFGKPVAILTYACAPTHASYKQIYTHTRTHGLLHPDLSHAATQGAAHRVGTVERTRIRDTQDTAYTLTRVHATAN